VDDLGVDVEHAAAIAEDGGRCGENEEERVEVEVEAVLVVRPERSSGITRTERQRKKSERTIIRVNCDKGIGRFVGNSEDFWKSEKNNGDKKSRDVKQLSKRSSNFNANVKKMKEYDTRVPF
jgi:hypothetical protein